MQKKLTLIILTTFLFLGFPSCDDDMGTCPVVDEFFDINGISIANFQIREVKFESGQYEQKVNSGETIAFDEFFMLVFFETSYYSDRQALLNFDLSNKAFALSCFEHGYMGTKEELDTLYVITNNDFNENYSAGDTINDIVEVNEFISFYSDMNNFKPLTSYFEENKENISEERFTIKLNQNPKFKDLSHSFKIVYKLENGEEYSAQTETVKFE